VTARWSRLGSRRRSGASGGSQPASAAPGAVTASGDGALAIEQPSRTKHTAPTRIGSGTPTAPNSSGCAPSRFSPPLLEIYTALVDTRFPQLKQALGLASVAPAALVADLYVAPPSGSGSYEPPRMRISLRPLPANSVTVRLVPSEDHVYSSLSSPPPGNQPARSPWARPSTPVVSEPKSSTTLPLPTTLWLAPRRSPPAPPHRPRAAEDKHCFAITPCPRQATFPQPAGGHWRL
jgi:hypothetical protein